MTKIVRTWWGERFLEALERCMDSGRLSRGRSYSSPSRLLEFDIHKQKISAHLKGNKNPYFGVYKTPYYDATITLKTLTKTQWKGIIGALSQNAAWLSKLLMNEMPENIEAAFRAEGVALLPSSGNDLNTTCSCPDWANPCKHVAGTYYKVASLLDRDPFLLFQLRGMELQQLQQELAKTPLGKVLLEQWGENREQAIELHSSHYTQPVLESDPPQQWRTFWQSEQPLPVEPTQTDETPLAILVKRGGDYPPFWHSHHSFITAMEGVYSKVLQKNRGWL